MSKLLKLPLWDLFEGWFKSEYPSLDFEQSSYWLFMILFIIAVFLVLLLLWISYRGIYDFIDKKKSTTEQLSGILIDKKYIGERNSSGIGSAILPNSSGSVSVGMVSTNSSSPEEFLFFVKSDKIYKVNTNMQTFYEKNIGDTIMLSKCIGGLSKNELTISLNQ